MIDIDAMLGALDEMPTHQLDQLNRLLDAARRYLPRENLSPSQAEWRAFTIGKAVARLRAGINDAELETVITEFRNHRT